MPIVLAPMGACTSGEFAAAVSVPSAGQTAGGITEIPGAAELMHKLVDEAEAETA